MSHVAILGAGSWGTVLAALFVSSGHSVALWGRSATAMATVAETRRNANAAPDLVLPVSVDATADLPRALAGAEIVLFALPTSAMRSVAEAAAPHLTASAVVSCAKGFEPESALRMSQVLGQTLPGRRIAVLSGPNLAAEIAAGRPAASVIACADRAVAERLQERLSSPRLRLYTNADVVGVEYAGALKNCIAIAAGVADGLQLGVNARAGLVTRGLAEITRLGVAAGARPLTFAGLAGLGDLIATCSSPLSRNYRVGLHLARGERWPQIAALIGHVAEGVGTTVVARELARRHGVRIPIIQHVYEVLFEGRPVPEAIRALLESAPRDELAELVPGDQ